MISLSSFDSVRVDELLERKPGVAQAYRIVLLSIAHLPHRYDVLLRALFLVNRNRTIRHVGCQNPLDDVVVEDVAL